MSKVICDICGTSYPETSTQCPICGYVRPAETVAVSDSEPQSSGYTYVKGGRFSKANVRKRNQAAAAQAAASVSRSEENDEKKPANKKAIGLIIVLTCLILIVGCMIAYIVINLPDSPFKFNTQQSDPTDIPCTDITLVEKEHTFNKLNDSFQLQFTVTPSDTTEKLGFTSSDEMIAAVTDDGKVVCVGNGEAIITVSCGAQKDQCKIICEIAEPPTTPPTETEPEKPVIKLDRENIEGEDVIAGVFQWPLYVQGIHGDLPVYEINWVSDNEAVATVDESGVVYAVGPGTTLIRAEYKGETIAICGITCIGDGESGGEPTEPTESTEPTEPEETTKPTEAGDAGKLTPYTEYGKTFSEGNNVYSITLNAGSQVNLYMKDASGNKVSVTWSVVEGDCTIDDSSNVKKNASGTCKVKAEYEGQTYYVIIF